MKSELVIGLVGPCGAGKSTLKTGLQQHGYQHVRHIAQEHSYVPYMWQRISHPDVLIFLDVSFPISLRRRPLNWNLEEFHDQQNRLVHARRHANLYIDTDLLSPPEILDIVLQYLNPSSNE